MKSMPLLRVLFFCLVITLFGALCGASEVRVISDNLEMIGGESIRQWIRELQAPDEEQRKNAFFILSELTARHALPEFIKDETDERMKAMLQVALESSNAPVISDALFDEIVAGYIAALEFPDSSTVDAMVYILGNSRAKVAVPVLMKLVGKIQEPALVVNALGKMGPAASEALPYLTEAARKPESSELRYAAVEALARIGDSGVIPTLVELCGLAQDEDVRWRAEDGLSRLLSKYPEQATPEVIDILIKNLRDNSGRRVPRTFAAYALSVIGEKAQAAIPDLLAMLEDQDAYHRKAAVIALSRIAPGDSKVYTFLKNLEKDPELAVRAAVMEELEKNFQAVSK